MKNFLLLAALILSFAFDARASLDATSAVVCSIINYVQNLGSVDIYFNKR